MRKRLPVAALLVIACVARGAAGPAAIFAAPEVDGGNFDLSATKGKVTVLAFFATWCDDCRAELPSLGRLYHDLRPKGLEVLAVSIERSRSRGAVKKMAGAQGLPVAMVGDATANAFGTPSLIPTIYVIDRAGKVRARLVPTNGTSLPDEVDHAVRQLL